MMYKIDNNVALEWDITMVQENLVTLKLNWKHCFLACIGNVNMGG